MDLDVRKAINEILKLIDKLADTCTSLHNRIQALEERANKDKGK